MEIHSYVSIYIYHSIIDFYLIPLCFKVILCIDSVVLYLLNCVLRPKICFFLVYVTCVLKKNECSAFVVWNFLQMSISSNRLIIFHRSTMPWWFSLCSINYWEKSTTVFNCNCRYVSFLFQYSQFLLHCFEALLIGAYTFILVMPSWLMDVWHYEIGQFIPDDILPLSLLHLILIQLYSWLDWCQNTVSLFTFTLTK